MSFTHKTQYRLIRFYWIVTGPLFKCNFIERRLSSYWEEKIAKKRPKIQSESFFKTQRWDQNVPCYRCSDVLKCLVIGFWQTKILIYQNWSMQFYKYRFNLPSSIYQNCFSQRSFLGTGGTISRYLRKENWVGSLCTYTTGHTGLSGPNRHIWCDFLWKKGKMLNF